MMGRMMDGMMAHMWIGTIIGVLLIVQVFAQRRSSRKETT